MTKFKRLEALFDKIWVKIFLTKSHILIRASKVPKVWGRGVTVCEGSLCMNRYGRDKGLSLLPRYGQSK